MKPTLTLDVDIKRILKKIFDNKNVDVNAILPKLEYIDACYYVIEYLSTKLKESKDIDYQKIYDILTNISFDETEVKYSSKDSKKNKKFQYSKIERLYVQLWLAFLKSKLPENIRLDSILFLGDTLLDQVSDPSVFSDLVIKSFEKDRQSGIITLRSIYKLMFANQMQYNPIYEVLLSLMNEDIFQSPFCSRFFDDLSAILSSRTMPHSTAIQFITRLSQMTMSGAASQHLPMLVRLIINLLKRHPGAQLLVHCKVKNDTEESIDKNVDCPKSILEIKDLQNYFDVEIRNLALEINFKLNDRIDNTLPSANIEAKQKKISKSRQKIKDAIESLMMSNCTLPDLEEIENFGTTSMKLF